jgi:hypothetical protein
MAVSALKREPAPTLKMFHATVLVIRVELRIGDAMLLGRQHIAAGEL